jgi:hypothetical protein
MFQDRRAREAADWYEVVAAGNLGDRRRFVLDRRKHAPACRRLPDRLRTGS